MCVHVQLHGQMHTYADVPKGQLISEAIFAWLQISKKANKIFWRISALAFKMGPIKKSRHIIIMISN